MCHSSGAVNAGWQRRGMQTCHSAVDHTAHKVTLRKGRKAGGSEPPEEPVLSCRRRASCGRCEGSYTSIPRSCNHCAHGCNELLKSCVFFTAGCVLLLIVNSAITSMYRGLNRLSSIQAAPAHACCCLSTTGIFFSFLLNLRP